MTSLGIYYKRGFQFLVYHRDADFELNTSVILSASGFLLQGLYLTVYSRLLSLHCYHLTCC